MKTLILILLFIFLSGCSEKWKDDKYSVSISPEDPSRLTLYISHETIQHGRIEWVKKIGSNSSYIIAEDTNGKYWIIDKLKDQVNLNADEIVIGPLLLKEFEESKKKLNIMNVKLTLVKA